MRTDCHWYQPCELKIDYVKLVQLNKLENVITVEYLWHKLILFSLEMQLYMNSKGVYITTVLINLGGVP